MHIIIIGGGLAGLVNALLLSQKPCRITLIEKNNYPFHRVCGEYISNETLPFLQSLGFNPFDYGAVTLNRFVLSAPSGVTMELPLSLGGFGLSRYVLDEQLYRLALSKGVNFLLKTQVQEVHYNQKKYQVNIGNEVIESDFVIGSFGKLSILDYSLKRDSFQKKSPYIGVKHHIQLADISLHPKHTIALHNFEQGYCGISRVENNTYCLCYLTTRKQLKKYKNITTLESAVLQKNPHLKRIFQQATFQWEKPKVINEISFGAKKLIENEAVMCGDSAGMIAPLCGNGMAMAIHSAKLLAEELGLWVEGKQTKAEALKRYSQQWHKRFAQRLQAGRWIQRFFGHPLLSEALVRGLRHSPTLSQWVIRQTHGQVF